MYEALNSITILMIAHFIGDFVCQSDRVAKNKSKSNRVLFEHVIIYMLVIALMCQVFFSLKIDSLALPIFCAINFALHFAIDYVTSRVNSYLYLVSRHWFFVCIGFDQLCHIVSLIWTWYFCFVYLG